MRELKRRKKSIKRQVNYRRDKKRAIRKEPERKIKRRQGSSASHKSKVTRQCRQILFEAITLGMTRKTACALAGINYQTFSNYMDYGKDKAFTKHYHFRKKILRLEAQRESQALEVIKEAAAGGKRVKKTKIKSGVKDSFTEITDTTLAPQWQAAAWYLERKMKKDWGRDSIQDAKTPAEIAHEVIEAQQLINNSIPIQE